MVRNIDFPTASARSFDVDQVSAAPANLPITDGDYSGSFRGPTLIFVIVPVFRSVHVRFRNSFAMYIRDGKISVHDPVTFAPITRRVAQLTSFVVAIIIIIIIIRNLYSAIMPLGGYRGAGGTGR